MPRPNDLGCLSPSEWDRLEEMADRFEEAWKNGDQVDLGSFLPPTSDPLRRTALEELIKSDLEIRGARGQAVDLKAYVARFAELGDVRSLSPKLVYEEYRVRQRYGDCPPLEVYRDRFPDQFAELQRLVNADPVTPVNQITTAAGTGDKMTQSAPMVISTGNILSVGGGYKMVKRIGRGSFGEVWQAEAPGGIAVAMKIILRTVDDEEGRRERHALEVIKSLSHPFLLPTHSFWVLEDRLVIVMELADGSLRDVLNHYRHEGQAGIPPPELLRYFREAADALDYLHAEKVLHRDIKPDNILVRNHRVRVADFGLVREQNQYLLTASSSGTPAYMAPEVWRGKTVLHSDQYSLACTYAELRLGRRPFTDADYAGLMLSHLQGRPDLEPLPELEQQVLMRALSKEPADRYPTCSEFAQALGEALGELGGKPTQISASLPVSGSRPAVQPMAPSMPGGPTLPPPPLDRNTTITNFTAPPGPQPTSMSSEPTDDPRPGAAPPPPRPPMPSQGGWADRTTPPPPSQVSDWRGRPARPPATSRGVMTAVAIGVILVVLGGGVAAYFVLSRGGAATQTSGATSATEVTSSATTRATTRATSPVTTAPSPSLPPGYTKASGAREERDLDGHLYYDRIQRQVAGRPVVFVLIPRRAADDLPSFYLSENKIWNGVYREFVAQNAAAAQDRAWQRGGQKDSQDAGAGDDLPVLRVTRDEAERAAAWLGGRLPRVVELDRAAGLANHPATQNGPARGPSVAVGRRKEGPRPVHDDTDDVSPSGIRDLAGNSQEWTSDTIETEDGKRVAVLRGRSYLAPTPLLYADLQYQQKEPLTQYPDHASPYTGFRVVVEPPAK